MKQLNDLKDEVASLQKDLSAKQDQKATLDKEVADKNAKLKKCNDDQQVDRLRRIRDRRPGRGRGSGHDVRRA